MVRHIIVLMCHVCGIYVFVSSCKCYSRLVNVCHGFVPSCFCYFCHSNVFHAHACHAIVCHAIVTSCKCLSCKRDHVNERHTSASSRVPRWLRRCWSFLYNTDEVGRFSFRIGVVGCFFATHFVGLVRPRPHSPSLRKSNKQQSSCFVRVSRHRGFQFP